MHIINEKFIIYLLKTLCINFVDQIQLKTLYLSDFNNKYCNYVILHLQISSNIRDLKRKNVRNQKLTEIFVNNN